MFETQPAPKLRACTSAFHAGTDSGPFPTAAAALRLPPYLPYLRGVLLGMKPKVVLRLRLLAEGLIALTTAGNLLLEGRRGSLHLLVTIHNDKSTARKKKKVVGGNNVFFSLLSLVFPVPPTDRTEWDSC